MSKDKNENGEGEVKITDKRRFTPEGESREGSGAEGDKGRAGDEEAMPDVKGASEADSHGSKSGPLPEIDFSTFMLSLATSAQVHLGVLANPATGKQESDLAFAKQTIDILGILQDKTKGNLSDEESRLLEHILYDLRMMYVEKNK